MNECRKSIPTLELLQESPISDSVDSGKFKLSNKRLNNYLNEIDSKLMLEFPTGFPKDKIDS